MAAMGVLVDFVLPTPLGGVGDAQVLEPDMSIILVILIKMV
jgi:hypothetical protein